LPLALVPNEWKSNNMSTTAADVYDRSAYRTPEANLIDRSEPTENKLYSAEGRVGVWHYNAQVFKAMLVTILAGAAVFAAMSTGSQVAMAIVGVPAILLVVAVAVAVIFTAIKRLHDLGHSGWFYLISLIPLIGLFFHLYYALRPGGEDDNAYGAPRAATQTDKVLGFIGIVLGIGVSIMALIPTG